MASQKAVPDLPKIVAAGKEAKPNLMAANRQEILTLDRMIPGLAVEQQRNAFVQQTRVPVVNLFGGRLQLAAMVQRVRTVDSHSAVLHPDAAASLRTSGAGTLALRPGKSMGGGIWLRLDRPQA